MVLIWEQFPAKQVKKWCLVDLPAACFSADSALFPLLGLQVRRIKALCQRTDGSGCPSGASSPKYRLLAPGPELTPALPCSLLPRLYRAEGSVTEEGRSFHQTLRGGFPQFSFQEQKKIFFFQQKYTQPHISRLSISCIKLGFYPEQTGPCRAYSTCREAAWQHVLK